VIRFRHGFFDLAFDNAALFLDNKHFFLVVNKLENTAPFKWPDQAHFVDIEPHVPGMSFINAEQIKRFQQIQMPFSGGDYSKTCVWLVKQAAVDRIRSGKSLHSRQFMFNTGFQLRPR